MILYTGNNFGIFCIRKNLWPLVLGENENTWLINNKRNNRCKYVYDSIWLKIICTSLMNNRIFAHSIVRPAFSLDSMVFFNKNLFSRMPGNMHGLDVDRKIMKFSLWFVSCPVTYVPRLSSIIPTARYKASPNNIFSAFCCLSVDCHKSHENYE